MRTCPVCESECDTLLCSRCGFDGSRDYERWPTVAALKAPVDSVAKRRAAFVSASEPEKKPKRRLWQLILSVGVACLLIILAVLLYHPRDGWFEKFGKTYYYEDGRKTFGFTQVGNDMYYFDGNGVMQTGRELIHGECYYFNSDGIMQTGWQQPFPDLDHISDAWCYYDENGVQQHDWITIDGKTYWLDTYYGRVTGLQTIDGKTYYFDAEGVMQKDFHVTIDGVDYYFDKNGIGSVLDTSDEKTSSTNQTDNFVLELRYVDISLDVDTVWNIYDGPIDAKEITWTSDNSEIATVINGLIMARSRGTTTIHAEYQGQKVSCIVRVE